MELHDTEQDQEFKEMGFTEARQRRGIIKWILAISVTCNIYQYYDGKKADRENKKVLYEMLKIQLDTKQKVDSTINIKL
jgi:hypothetical protein